ncbi:MAG: FHA domain-containing protein [Gemmataceae bacterium]|nr:FHA domain-containing protein [Gemmataceae bacterium]
MPAQLVALTEGPSILLDKPIMLFGRNPECDIQIDSRKVSRRHCCIAQVNDYLVVRDLGSTNGIRINGVRTLEGKLNAGDELTIGSHRYRISWDVLDGPGSGVRAIPAPEFAPARNGTAAEPEEDDMLEECDEPVPLPDPVPGQPAPWFIAPGGPAGATAIAAENEPGRPRASRDSKPVLPENIELAPSSDAISTDRAGNESPS